jgi:hypothetical protein
VAEPTEDPRSGKKKKEQEHKRKESRPPKWFQRPLFLRHLECECNVFAGGPSRVDDAIHNHLQSSVRVDHPRDAVSISEGILNQVLNLAGRVVNSYR